MENAENTSKKEMNDASTHLTIDPSTGLNTNETDAFKPDLNSHLFHVPPNLHTTLGFDQIKKGTSVVEEKYSKYDSPDLFLRLPTDEKRQYLVEGLSEFWDPSGSEVDKFQDVQIFCGKGGNVIETHRLVLSSISFVFEAALKSVPNNDAFDNAIIIPDIHADQLSEVLGCIYSGKDDEVIIPSEMEYLNISPSNINHGKHISYNEPSCADIEMLQTLKNPRRVTENKSRMRRSFIWDYFVKLSGKETSVCNMCGKMCNMFSGNTSGLIKHLKNKHQSIYLEFKSKRMDMSFNSSIDNRETHETYSQPPSRMANRKGSKMTKTRSKNANANFITQRDDAAKAIMIGRDGIDSEYVDEDILEQTGDYSNIENQHAKEYDIRIRRKNVVDDHRTNRNSDLDNDTVQMTRHTEMKNNIIHAPEGQRLSLIHI